MGNMLQAKMIRRYQRHLWRNGRGVSLDEAARLWISRYAHLWRNRYETRRPA